MITGKLPFKGEYESAIMYSILHTEPEPLSQHKSDIPEYLQLLVGKALAKNVEERYQDVDEMLVDLKQESSKEKTDLVISRERTKRGLFKNKKLILTLSAFIIVIFCYFFLKLFQKEKPLWLQEKSFPKRLTSESGNERGRISPDGKYLVYQDKSIVKLKNIQTGEIKILSSEGGQFAQPVWSTDEQYIAFVKLNETEISIIICNILGNITHQITTQDLPFFLSWSSDCTHLSFTTEDEDGIIYLKIINLKGEIKHDFLMETFVAYISWSPDSRKIALIQKKQEFIGAIRLLDIETGTISDILKGNKPYCGAWWKGGLVWSPDGNYILYVGYNGTNRELFALPMNPKTFKSTGSPIQITKLNGNGEPVWPSITSDGQVLSYGIDEQNVDIYAMSMDLQTASISGTPIEIATDRQLDRYPSWSPDGKKVVFSSRRDGQPDLYLFNLETNETRRLTLTEENERYPQFSPDGENIAYCSNGIIWGIPTAGERTALKLSSDSIKVFDRFIWTNDGSGFIVNLQDEFYYKIIKIGLGSADKEELIDKIIIYSDFALSPDGNQLVIDGISVLSDTVNNDEIVILDMKNKREKSFYKYFGLMPRGRLSWTFDANFILHDRYSAKGNIFELLPVSGGPPIEVSFDRNKFSGNVFIGPIDSTGKKVLLTTHNEESDIWLLGEN